MEPATPPACGHAVYTSCYCEENIYLLIKRFLNPAGGEEQWDAFAVFVSNPTKTVALWNQRMGSSTGDVPVVWDYHVVLALRERPRAHSQSPSGYLARGEDAWIYDLDTRLPVPCHWSAYVNETFPLGAGIPLHHQSLFRVISGGVYIDNFASDRSHMLDVSTLASGAPRYLAVPPSYPAIRGPEAERRGTSHNLATEFVSMARDGQGFGTVMDLDEFRTWCGGVTT